MFKYDSRVHQRFTSAQKNAFDEDPVSHGCKQRLLNIICERQQFLFTYEHNDAMYMMTVDDTIPAITRVKFFKFHDGRNVGMRMFEHTFHTPNGDAARRMCKTLLGHVPDLEEYITYNCQTMNKFTRKECAEYLAHYLTTDKPISPLCCSVHGGWYLLTGYKLTSADDSPFEFESFDLTHDSPIEERVAACFEFVCHLPVRAFVEREMLL
jgi:hypothetical protein